MGRYMLFQLVANVKNDFSTDAGGNFPVHAVVPTLVHSYVLIAAAMAVVVARMNPAKTARRRHT